MNNKTTLKENLNREIKEFRQSFESMNPEDVYDSFYLINFYEEYYMLLMSDFIDDYEQIIKWLSKFQYPLEYLYGEWLRCDRAFSGDWNDMMNFITNLYEEEK